MVSANQIRGTFLDYFKGDNHAEIDSSPLVPQNDPTLMFTNAGMVQFKNVFLGQDQRPYSRAVTSQKCVRAGGKHNDLDNVGYTARHHTFFEMLGNFSFGDYFKEHAIEMAWNLVTKEFELAKEKLLVTVYHTDDEAVELWKKIAGLGDDRIIRIPTSDNFWTMGETGPCGPCSEIFFDHGDHIWGGPPGSPEEDGDRFIEIWNLVFMQFDVATPGGPQNPLPKPSIDTGMGLERIAAILQGKHDNYDIDLMRALIENSAHASNDDPDGPNQKSHRVIADHLRSSAFLIADGVQPSNEGRGYVLRRIMRRAMRHAHKIGNQDPLMHKLVPALVREMGEHFGELKRAESMITEVLKLEETRFKETLDRGLKLLTEETNRLGDKEPLAGDVAFKLYDTYGFPLDLTQDILRGQERPVDLDGFNAAMEKQKAAARASWKGSGDASSDALWFSLRDQHGSTEFLGYAGTHAEGVCQALVQEGAEVTSMAAGQSGQLIASQTPFYAESGGQQGDHGTMRTEDGATLVVTDTRKHADGLFVHHVEVTSGELKVGDSLVMQVDDTRRAGLAAHHSATHLLHEALRRHLGDHVAQKGSLVAPDRLRFDFSHSMQMSGEQIEAVEDEINREILANTAVSTRIMSPNEAIAEGAQALFGEKYGDEVRVVSMGSTDDAGRVYSLELCGGTHVSRTGEIGLLKILREEGPAAGVRRIEAIGGEALLSHVRQREALVHQLAGSMRSGISDLPARVTALQDDKKKLEKELADTRRKLATGGAGGSAKEEVAGVGFIGKLLDDVPARDLKGMADELKTQVESGVVVLVSNDGGKAAVVVGVTADLVERFSAADAVKAASPAVGGKGGGGRPDMAQAGGPDGAAGQAAIEAVKALMSQQLGAA